KTKKKSYILDENVKAILVNVFGGIVNCATIANGIVNASKTIQLNIPLIVRLEGTNVNEAKQILANSNLHIQLASSLDDAAEKAKYPALRGYPGGFK
ncbi:unnamed protein product, partial [Timema podura]|nr:unnamed protein product [Timema podura]